jgi:hypothetical protein
MFSRRWSTACYGSRGNVIRKNGPRENMVCGEMVIRSNVLHPNVHINLMFRTHNISFGLAHGLCLRSTKKKSVISPLHTMLRSADDCELSSTLQKRKFTDLTLPIKFNDKTNKYIILIQERFMENRFVYNLFSICYIRLNYNFYNMCNRINKVLIFCLNTSVT